MLGWRQNGKATLPSDIDANRCLVRRRLPALGLPGGLDKLSKAIGRTGWYEFRRQLDYKAARTGRTVAAVSRWYPSSKTCSACGHLLAELSLGTRHWACPRCGTRHSRDHNAAKNILTAGLAVAGGEPPG